MPSSSTRTPAKTRLAKAPTTPHAPAEGVLEAIARLGTPLEQVDTFVHGTTLGLNAIIERKGSVTGIITNAGFRDLFEIGRADVPASHMFDFAYQRPPSLVKRRHRIGVPGRLDAGGQEVVALDEQAVLAAAAQLRDAGVQAIAVSMLHSYLNPRQEMRVAELVRAHFPDLPVSISSEISREYREYERTSTTVLDAYIRPIYERYLSALEQAFEAKGFTGRFLIMRSSGGAMTSRLASRSPVFTVMSGPAGGMIGVSAIARELGLNRLLSLDYGGTSLDASVVEDGEPLVIYEASLEHFPALTPIFDIRCIGTGGGSIARVRDGLLQVGPDSAGSVPGPVAYGRGGVEPTTTDAALALGYLDPAAFLGGTLQLDIAGSTTAIDQKLAAPLSTDVATAAAGVFDVLIAKTIGAIREITVDRGKDPSEFSLLAFGGAGPMIAPLLAREIDVVELIVPAVPAVFSAWGMLMSELVSDFSKTSIHPLDPAHTGVLEEGFGELSVPAIAQMREQGIAPDACRLDHFIECRYVGQEHTLRVAVQLPLDPAVIAARFNAMHDARYGHTMPDAVQAVTLRIRAVGQLEKPPLNRLPPATGTARDAVVAQRQAYCFAVRGVVPFQVYARHKLAPGHTIDGPAIIDEGTSTTVIHSDQALLVNDYGHLIIKGKQA
ncbi:MAG: hydantoinase/oxoprolinase family protein [Pseudomonas sp.]